MVSPARPDGPVSLAFEILFSTVITLVLVPSIYMAGADIRAAYVRMRAHERHPAGIKPSFKRPTEKTA